jgi:hypothetical protein
MNELLAKYFHPPDCRTRKLVYCLVTAKNLEIFRYSGIFVFSYLTDLSYFPLKIVFRKLLDMFKTGIKKNSHFERGCNDFSYFSLISVVLFSNQDHPWILWLLCKCVFHYQTE